MSILMCSPLPHPELVTCPACGRLIEQGPRRAGRPKLYCGSTCRERAWRKRAYEDRRTVSELEARLADRTTPAETVESLKSELQVLRAQLDALTATNGGARRVRVDALREPLRVAEQGRDRVRDLARSGNSVIDASAVDQLVALVLNPLIRAAQDVVDDQRSQGNE